MNCLILSQKKTKKMLGYNSENINDMLGKANSIMAQKHFLWAREQELIKIKRASSFKELLDSLQLTYETYLSTIEELKEAPSHLLSWVEALRGETD